MLDNAYVLVHQFKAGSLKERLAHLERELQQKNVAVLSTLLPVLGVETAVLTAALNLKRATSQIDEVVHAVGILLALPHVLAEGEVILDLSLGAGNTGKRFDLETDRRVAEFKFIGWQGGAESIRQNALFKDFCRLVWYESNKEKYLYVVGSMHPLRFLNGGRALTSVMSRNVALRDEFRQRHGVQYHRVRDYYAAMQDQVRVVDLEPYIPSLGEIAAAVQSEGTSSID